MIKFYKIFFLIIFAILTSCSSQDKKISKEALIKFDNSNIPKNTLRLIEEAEKSKN